MNKIILAFACVALSTTIANAQLLISNFDDFNSPAISGTFGNGSGATPTQNSGSVSFVGGDAANGFWGYLGTYDFTGFNALELTATAGTGASDSATYAIEFREGSTTIACASWLATELTGSAVSKSLNITGNLANVDRIFFIGDGDIINGNQFNIEYDNLTATAIPEPSTFALLAMGAAGLAFVRRKR